MRKGDVPGVGVQVRRREKRRASDRTTEKGKRRKKEGRKEGRKDRCNLPSADNRRGFITPVAHSSACLHQLSNQPLDPLGPDPTDSSIDAALLQIIDRVTNATMRQSIQVCYYVYILVFLV